MGMAGICPPSAIVVECSVHAALRAWAGAAACAGAPHLLFGCSSLLRFVLIVIADLLTVPVLVLVLVFIPPLYCLQEDMHLPRP